MSFFLSGIILFKNNDCEYDKYVDILFLDYRLKITL